MVVRVVIDRNRLESDELDQWLAKDAGNRAVITDFTSLECHTGSALKNLWGSLAVLEKYPKQVDVLQGTTYIGSLAPSEATTGNMIDEKATRDFEDFTLEIRAAANGHAFINQKILERQFIAENKAQAIRDAEGEYHFGYMGLMEKLSPACLERFRKHNKVDKELSTFIMEHALAFAYGFYTGHPMKPKIPPIPEIRDSYLFRFSVATMAMLLNYIKLGLSEPLSAKKLQNHLIDSTYVAYGTMFDGVMSQDEFLLKNYVVSRGMLENLFKPT